jgi:hypothetical protein
VAAAPRQHPLERQLRPEDDPVEVDVDHRPRGLVRLLDERADRHDPGVVDDHVDRAELVLGLVEEAAERVTVGDVELEGDGIAAELGRGLLGEVGVDVADRDPGAAADQRLCRAAADSARPPGDRHRLPRYRLHLLARHDGSSKFD